MDCSIIVRPAWLRGLVRRHTVQVASFLARGLLTVALVTGSATHITARAAHRERPALVPPARVAMVILPGVRLGSDGKRHDAYTPTDLTALAGQKVLVTVYNYDTGMHSFTAPATEVVLKPPGRTREVESCILPVAPLT
jgi:hypothetical protein